MTADGKPDPPEPDEIMPPRPPLAVFVAAMILVAAMAALVVFAAVNRSDIIAAQAAAEQRAKQSRDEWYREVARTWMRGLVDELRAAYPYDSETMLWERARAIVRESLGPTPAPPPAESE